MYFSSITQLYLISQYDIIPMNNKHSRTLETIFENPVRSSIEWNDIEAMLVAFGADISKGSGSRVRIVLNGACSVFHRPHPRKEMDKGSVKSMRRFLGEAGIHS